MVGMSIEVIEDNTGIIAESIKNAIMKSLEEIGLKAEGDAKKLCPVDTGRLRNSITHRVEGGEKAVYIGTNVEYGKYVELGTSKRKEHPFLRPAAQRNGGVYHAIVKKNMQKG